MQLLPWICILFLHPITSAMIIPPTSMSVGSTALCDQFRFLLGNITIPPTSSEYNSISDENWSETTWMKPSCIVQPLTALEVQKIVRTLVRTNTSFAIRSGGHSPSPGAANIDNGVLIDMSRLDQVTFDAESSLATVGSGQTWSNVYESLDRYNVTIVGGRVLDVGVGGLVLGGGLSYLTDLYGLVCDNVVNFQVVTANGSMINANATSNPDLWWALKGGSNNFGVVTSFTLNTYPIHTVWGGIKEYALEYLPDIMAAMYIYQSNPNKDAYANLMLQAFTTNSSVGVVLNMVYLKPVENPPAFEPFYQFPTIDDTTKLQTLTEMISGQRVPNIPRWDWHATSFEPDADLYQEIANITLHAPELKQIESLTSGSLALGLQPISTNAVLAGQARGGNPLGLRSVNQTWFVLDVGWNDASGDAIAHNATASMRAKVEAASKKHNKYVEYIFMNDASHSQDVIEHYGEASVEKLKAVERKYDPTSAFHRWVPGGFKVPE